MKKGQAMVEYMLVFASIVILSSIVGYVVVAAERHADETITLVSMDCP